ncbi:MAG: hypothetical protein WBP54_05110 [Pelodictyon phaeoclathratiforme]
MEIKSFSGTLEASGYSTPITFSASISHAGKIIFDFGVIPLIQENAYILKLFHKESIKSENFTLSGTSEDGTEFTTKDLYFTCLNDSWSKEAGSLMRPVGECQSAELLCTLDEISPKPLLRIRLKGFQNFHRLKATCRLGLIDMGGASSIDDPDTVTGAIEIRPEIKPVDLATWHDEADKLLEHIRRLMSVASAATLQVPIIEYIVENKCEITVFSQSRHAPSSMDVIHFLDQQPFFEAAVKSFFEPPIRVKNLFFAIEWFSMDPSYSEVRLVNAMTALENLVDSHLADSDALIRPKGEFNKTRRVLRQVIKQCIEKWSDEDSETVGEAVKNLNEKLADLNRRSIFEKIKRLAELWSVPLDGISDKQIQSAKGARDLIVHRGNYYEEGEDKSDDLWEHVTVIREIVVRFFLTAINFKGSYCSYLGGYHITQFPPDPTDLSS